MVFALLILSVLAVLSVSAQENYDTSTLKLVHVLVRHGNRTVEKNDRYPKDPHYDFNFYPYGYGELTSKGKVKAYSVGVALRKRYGAFLGDIYVPEVVDAVSTNFNRTKMTLQLLLAGLFPPVNTSMEWNYKLNWQPIPFSIVPVSDHLLGFPLYNCAKYIKLRRELLKSDVGIAIHRRYAAIFKYLTLKTGINITDVHQILILYTTLTAQEDWGLKLPPWTRSIYPDVFEAAGGDDYLINTYTSQLRKLSGGFLLKKIIDDSKSKLENTMAPSGRKLFVYSAHDVNIGWVMGAMKILFPHEPPYSAYLLVEIHTVKNVDGVKIFYQDYSGKILQQLVVPGCEKFCPFTKFVSLLKNSLPNTDEGDPCDIGPDQTGIFTHELQLL